VEGADPTFTVREDARGRLIQCHLCGAVSRLAGDIEHRYCARCHLFHGLVADGRRLRTHDCGEWRTYRDRCALCDRDLRVPRLQQSSLW
jgi:hypothetical protein